MPNNSYDAYAQHWFSLKQGKYPHYAHDYLEKPAMYTTLGSCQKAKVLSLGCGSGEEIAEIFARGAQHVHGVDSSQELISYAQNIENRAIYTCSTIEEFTAPHTYDIIFSSLAFHYIEHWEELVDKMKSWLKPGGRLLFSTHHPIKWGAQSQKNTQFNEFKLGYKKDKKDNTYIVYGDYLRSRKIEELLFGKIPISHYHRSISQWINPLLQAGFTLTNCIEPTPIQEAKKIKQDFYEVHSKIPLFLILDCHI